MTRSTFTIEYTFTSTKAYGDDYTLRIEVEAKNAQSALTVARIEGFSRFGARFNDNCIDWHIVPNR